MSVSPLFPRDFPEHVLRPVVKPVSREGEYARIMAEMDRTGMAGMLLNHLWLVSSKRCACGMRSEAVLGKHYVWWADHVAGLLVAAGFTSEAWTAKHS